MKGTSNTEIRRAGERTERTFVIDVRKRKMADFYTRCALVFWLIWTIVTISLTWAFITEFSSKTALWLFLGYTGILLIPLPALYVKGREILTARRDGLEVEYLGFLSRKYFFRKDELDLVSLEKYPIGTPTFGEAADEPAWTLNLVGTRRGKTKRLILAELAGVEEQEEIYARLVRFLEETGFIFERRNGHATLSASTRNDSD